VATIEGMGIIKDRIEEKRERNGMGPEPEMRNHEVKRE